MPENPFSIEINLATYGYLTLTLFVALFYKFSRPFSLRNFDVVIAQLPLVGYVLLATSPTLGYAVLLCFAAATVVRCYIDPGLERRPALGTNVTPGAMTFLVCVAVLFHVLCGRNVHPNQLDVFSKGADLGAAATPLVVWPAVRALVGPTWSYVVDLLISSFAHAAVAFALVMVGRCWFNDVGLGLASALCYVGSAAVLWSVGSPAHAVPPALLMVALVSASRPLVAGLVLGFVAGVTDGIVLLIPFWAPVLMRQHARGFAIGLLSGLAASWVVAYAGGCEWALGTGRLQTVYFDRVSCGPEHGIWGEASPALRLAVVAVTLGLVSGFLLWPIHKNMMSVVAASTAILAALQLWYPYGGGTYVTWYLPLLLLLIFRPTLLRLRL